MSEEEEEGGGGVVTTLVVVGAVGCGGLVLLGVLGAMFFGARSVSPGPLGGPLTPVAVATSVTESASARTFTDLGNGNSSEEWTTLGADGSRTFTRITTIDAVPTELRITWDALDSFVEDASGLYESGARVRALTAEERSELGG